MKSLIVKAQMLMSSHLDKKISHDFFGLNILNFFEKLVSFYHY